MPETQHGHNAIAYTHRCAGDTLYSLPERNKYYKTAIRRGERLLIVSIMFLLTSCHGLELQR